MRYVGSRSLKVIEFSTIGKGIFDFLLVANSNLAVPGTVSELQRDLRKILHGGQRTAHVYSSEEILRKFLTPE